VYPQKKVPTNPNRPTWHILQEKKDSYISRDIVKFALVFFCFLDCLLELVHSFFSVSVTACSSELSLFFCFCFNLVAWVREWINGKWLINRSTRGVPTKQLITPQKIKGFSSLTRSLRAHFSRQQPFNSHINSKSYPICIHMCVCVCIYTYIYIYIYIYTFYLYIYILFVYIYIYIQGDQWECVESK